MDDNIFSGIPALGDTQGLEQLMNDEALTNMGLNGSIPPAIQPNPAPQANPAQETAQTNTDTTSATGTEAPTTFTSEQVAQIIAQMRNTGNAEPQKPAPAPAPTAQPTAPAYTPQQATVIKQLIDKGVSLDRIMAAMKGNTANNELSNRVQQVEQYLEQQRYQSEQAAFVNKMTTFGGKYGLSEDDLVTFANAALEKGINLTQVADVETIFRAMYPEQYAIRTQRMNNAASSQIYGGANIAEAPRAQSSKMEDAYVDAFLKQSMPNQYSTFHNK